VEYDDIIVGGGSAGAVLAVRLSEEPARRVLLLEAGPDYVTVESTPGDLQDGWHMSLRAHDWGLTAEAVPGRVIPYPRARVVRGSSAVNATIALRGAPADYDQWAELGNDEWSWAKVLPSFRRLEDDPEGASELHGRGGPVAICRWRHDELIPTQRAFFDVCRRLGFPEVTDHNHPEAAGVGPFPQNRRGRLRLSTAIAYLLHARHRGSGRKTGQALPAPGARLHGFTGTARQSVQAMILHVPWNFLNSETGLAETEKAQVQGLKKLLRPQGTLGLYL
jgi:choline dehydrogenase